MKEQSLNSARPKIIGKLRGVETLQKRAEEEDTRRIRNEKRGCKLVRPTDIELTVSESEFLVEQDNPTQEEIEKIRREKERSAPTEPHPSEKPEQKPEKPEK